MASIIANNLLYHFWSKAIFWAYLHEIILSCRYRYKKRCSDWGILKSAFTPIVCLPNHLVIQYVNDDKEIDAMIN